MYSILLALRTAASAVKAVCRCCGRVHLFWILIPSCISELQFVNIIVTYSVKF
jgi:hypothetical protein